MGLFQVEYDDLPTEVKRSLLTTFYRSGLIVRGDYISQVKKLTSGVENLTDLKVDELSLEEVYCLLTYCFRADRFNEGALYNFVKTGFVQCLLTRIKQLN